MTHWFKNLPFTDLAIQHVTTREVKTLKVVSMSEDDLILHWPLYGQMHFNPHNGRGGKKTAQWWLTPESFEKVKDARKVKVTE